MQLVVEDLPCGLLIENCLINVDFLNNTTGNTCLKITCYLSLKLSLAINRMGKGLSTLLITTF